MLKVFVVVWFTSEVFRSKEVTRPGLEPGITESKSVVLPITLSGYKLVREFRKPIGCRQAVIGVKTESAA